MSFFKKIFGGEESQSLKEAAQSSGGGAPKAVKFGRYTDCNKSKEQVNYWKEAIDKFKNKAYVDSFEAFLLYLKDNEVNNVQVNREGDIVSFEIIQGSKIIRGQGDGQQFWAEANIVKMDGASLPVMRKLMSLNYTLRYSKFALKENILCMKFSSHAIDASPNKLYDALKELARKADQQDDLLVQEFSSSLEEIDTDNIIHLSPEHAEARYNYMRKLIQDCKAEIAKHDAEKMSGGIAFLLLNLNYTLDFLILPQGNLTDSFEMINSMFFREDGKSTREKNDLIIAEYDKILEWPKEKVMEGLYDVTCTFSVARPETHKYVMDFFFKEREKVGWYRDNGYSTIVESVYSYMITYAFFNMGMVYPLSDILNLGMHVLNPEYYASFGSTANFVKEGGALNGAAIQKEINRLMQHAKSDYPYAGFNTSALNFNSKATFLDSLIVELDKLNLSKA